MERVAFLIEESGERIGCMLNPESIVIRRRAGIEPRHSSGGLVTGAALMDEPLLFTGGGSTELELDLLFDTSLAGSSIKSEDVRSLTGPLWDLAENAKHQVGHLRPPITRFVWGKSWNIPAVVVAVAERLEYFNSDGLPRRSWLRMRLRRVIEPVPTGPRHPRFPEARQSGIQRGVPTKPGEGPGAHAVWSGRPEASDTLTGDRLDQLAHKYYGDASLWRKLALFNDISDPLHLGEGRSIQLPSLANLDSIP